MDQQHAMLNNSSFNLAEIWQYSMNSGGSGGGGGGGGGINDSGLGLGLKRGHFGQFGEINGKLSADELRRGAGGAAAHCGGGGSKKRRDLDDDLNKVVSTSGAVNNNSDGDGKRMKMTGNIDDNNNNRESNAESADPSSSRPLEKSSKPPEPPKDYIHVRARRGQATDSHSLAERARREKISERMKILQDLVPGCNKVIGKALVLDEIINYIQSLQRQVEFLSMKLEAVNSRINPGIEFSQQQFDNTGMAFASQPTREYNRGTSPEWLHMQVGGGFERPN